MEHPKHIVAVGVLIRNAEGEILLAKTERRGWEMPGGQVEEGEDIFTALEREVMEETNVTIRIQNLVAVYSSIDQPAKIIFDFIAEYTGGTVSAQNEILEVKWFSPEEALQMVTEKPMIHRIEWLLDAPKKLRYQVYSKNPFKVSIQQFIGGGDTEGHSIRSSTTD